MLEVKDLKTSLLFLLHYEKYCSFSHLVLGAKIGKSEDLIGNKI